MSDSNDRTDVIPPATDAANDQNKSIVTPIDTSVKSIATPIDTRVVGMDLTANLGSLTKNMVAIACQHKSDSESSSAINNFKKDLKSYTSVKIVAAQSEDVIKLNKNAGTDLGAGVKCHVLDSGENRNLTESPDKLNSAKLFALIKKAISSDTDISTGKVRSSKRTDIVALESELQTLSKLDLKFAAGTNACTQLVFGFELEGDQVMSVVGRIQSVGSGLTGDVQTGDFNMVLDPDGKKYVISAGKDSAPMITTLLKKILGLKKEIIVPKPEKSKKPEKPAAGADAAATDNAATDGTDATATLGGGKTKRRRNKKGTRKHKPKRTMKKRKSSRRRSSKK